jgi:predicted flap endonuclease-1-like 5' DNA nuclease
MLSVTLLPYIAAITMLITGVGIGWALHAGLRRRHSPLPDSVPAVAPPDEHFPRIQTSTEEKRKAVQEAEAMIARMETYLSTLNRDIAAAREQTAEKEREHLRLLALLDERRTSIDNAHGSLQNVKASLESREQETETLLTNIDKSLEEIDMLHELHETYVVKLNRLTQQVQWQDSEIRMLQQTIHAKSAEIDEARELLEQRDAELRRVNRQRQQREIDLDHLRKSLEQQNEELRQLLQRQNQQDQYQKPHPVITPPPADQHIVLPPRKPQPLLPEPAVSQSPADDSTDDLTEIPGLAEFYVLQLHTNGIRSFRALANTTPEEIERMLDIPGHFSPNITRWIEAARRRAHHS